MPAAAAPADDAVCPQGVRSFARLADLPPGAFAALDLPMADRGQPFQVSDAIGPGPRRPFARFIAAVQRGCALEIRYEYGGIAHGFAAADLALRLGGWVVLRRR